MEKRRPAWVEVDLEAIRHNVRRVRELIGPRCGILAVVKANGYGHGMVEAARAALEGGAAGLAVAIAAEATALREAGVTAPILVMGATLEEDSEELAAAGVVVAPDTRAEAEWLSRAAQRLGRTLSVHLKVDSGMGRRGAVPAGVPALVGQIRGLPGLSVEALFTHFATAGDPGDTFAAEQLRVFERCLAETRAATGLPLRAHAANSAGTLLLPEGRHDWVRPGLLTYGIPPFAGAGERLGLKPALRLKAHLASVKEMPAGAPIGYGRAYVMERPGRIAILPLGYGDGFSRHSTNNGEVLVRGRRVPIRGRVCMDQTLIEVTDVPEARVGDEAVLIGPQGDEEITAWEVAARTGTIAYETLCALTARLPRVYSL